MQHTAPRQTKLLGAIVRDLGLITSVSSTLYGCYAMCEGADGVRHQVPLRDLRKIDVVFPPEPQPYETRTERVAYNTWDEMFGLADAPAWPAIQLAA